MSEPSPVPGSFAIGRNTMAGAAILSPSSSLTYENCVDMRSALENACDGHTPRIVLDCRAVNFMDSEALELLVDLHEKLRTRQGELILTNLNDVCKDILTVSRLIHVLIVCGDINQAIRGGESL